MNNPFIKLLSYKNKLYFLYDVNRNEIKNITYETYYLLKDILSSKTTMTEGNFEIDRLQKDGYLLSDRPQNIEQPLNKYLSLYINNRINGIVLQVTQNCNLKCKYCVYAINGIYNRKHSAKNMEWDTAQRAIDYLREHSKDLTNVRISFYGGEPMLNMPLVEKAVLYAEKTMPYKKISFAMTTNLTLLSNDNIDFFKKHNFKLTVSLDGPRNVNDKNRFFAINGESTYDSVMDNLRKISVYNDYYNNNLQINSVMDKSVDRQYISDFFKNHEILKSINVGYSTVSDSNLRIQYYTSAQYIKSEKIKRFKDMLNSVLGTYDSNETFDDICQKLQKKSIPYSKQKKSHHNGPCIPGVKKLFVDVNGNLFPCEKANDISQHLKIGNIDDGIDIEKAKELYNLAKISEDECKSCWAIKLCSCCAVNIDDGKCISKDLKKSHCIAQRKRLENELVQLGLITLLSQESPVNKAII